MKKFILHPSSFILLLLLLFITPHSFAAQPTISHQYLPLIQTNPPVPMVELRGVWVNRFDWTTLDAPASPARIDEIVENIADAGFNVIFFQVRATADAYYDSDLEPWASRMSGTYGKAPTPLWDPLAHMVDKAHAKGIQVHAYINVYPVAGCNSIPPKTVTPTPLYHQLVAEHGLQNDLPSGLQWETEEKLACRSYLRASPASDFFNDHIIAIGRDLVTRYAIDGLHLDHIRYEIEGASCDPLSEASFGSPCFSTPGYEAWQREQINQLVRRFYNEVVPLKNGLWLSAAVWPLHSLKSEWNWPGFPEEGNKLYFQDSKAWLADGYIDSISPMIYPGGNTNCPDDSYWQLDRWETLVRDYQAGANGRFIIPGIGSSYCTFDEIEARIKLSRQIGTGGHALFSYFGLEDLGYFDELAEGVYQETAVVPTITWHP